MGAQFTAAQFRNLALRCVGKKYVLGVECHAKAGKLDQPIPAAFDCSELVEWLLDANGTPIGDLAAAQYAKTVAVKPGSERVGDLVFLANNPRRWNRIGHVAIITAKLGNGDWEIVEAKGRVPGVVKTTLSFWKTRPRFTGVRRFPKFELRPSTPAAPATAGTSSVPAASSVLFRIGWCALQYPKWGGPKNDGPVAAAIKKQINASIIGITESSVGMRGAIRTAQGGSDRWLTHVHPGKMLALVFDSLKWRHGGARSYVAPGSGLAGGMCVPLTGKNGATMEVIVCHARPHTVAGELARQKDIGAAMGLASGKYPAVLMGDFNTSDHSQIVKAGWVRVTPAVNTLRGAKHVHAYDAIYVKGVVKRAAQTVNPGRQSDHVWLLGNLTLKKGNNAGGGDG